MGFKIKNDEEIGKMSPEEQADYYSQAVKHTLSEISALKEKSTDNEKSSDEIEKLKAEFSELQEKELKALRENMTAIGKGVKSLLEKGVENGQKAHSLEVALKTKMEAIKSMAKRTSNEEAIELKANTVLSSVDSTTAAMDLPGVGQLATRKLSMYDAFPKITMSGENTNATIRYWDWDEDTISRAAAMVAETGSFPESTAKWKQYTLDLKKIGDTLPVSAEFFEDESLFAAELNMFLQTNVALELDNQICNGDGTGNNLTGLFTSAPAFNTALATTTVTTPTIYDLIAIATEQITITGGGKYMPNAVFMRKSTINAMRLSKDANENYILPPFVSRDGREIDSMMVIESNIVPDNQLVLGDTRFGRIYERTGIELSRGLVGTQFTDDMETLKARKRCLFLVREVDKTAFVKVTNITTALTSITAT